MDLFPILIVAVILFMAVVAPIWIVMHYKAKQPAQAAKPQRDLDGDDVDELLDTLETLLDRVENLERILDADNPEWRQNRR